MTSVSYITLLSNWFRIHIPLQQKSNITSISSRTGYIAAYPKIPQHHHRQLNRFFCIPLCNKTKKKKRINFLNNNKLILYKKNSSIPGCASFARYDTYEEGNSEDDC